MAAEVAVTGTPVVVEDVEAGIEARTGDCWIPSSKRKENTGTKKVITL